MNHWLILADISEADRNQLIFWLVILMVVVLAGFGAILLLRRRLREPPGAPTYDTGFSLSQLRAMRDRGEITPEEYEHTKARVIAKVKGHSPPPPPPPMPGSDPEADSFEPPVDQG